jgi:hypothetical protein
MSAIRPKAQGCALTGIANSGNTANGMPLNVRMPNGTTITPDVDPTDPVFWVKEKIEGFVGVDGLPAIGKTVTVQVQSSDDTVDSLEKLLGFWSKASYWNGRLQQKVAGRVASHREICLGGVEDKEGRGGEEGMGIGGCLVLLAVMAGFKVGMLVDSLPTFFLGLVVCLCIACGPGCRAMPTCRTMRR